jgi:DNA-dependent metalloprotease WSS1
VAKSKRARELRAEAALRRFGSQGAKTEAKDEDSGEDTESEEEEEEVVEYISLCGVTDFSIKPEDDDDDARGRMDDEMRGLVCGTSMDNAFEIDDDTASEEDEPDTPDKPTIQPSRRETAPVLETSPSLSFSRVSCKVCTTSHSPPVPVCCETCSNVLEPEKLSDERKWICRASGCQAAELGYINYGDSGTCGICGSTRQKKNGEET